VTQGLAAGLFDFLADFIHQFCTTASGYDISACLGQADRDGASQT
jgi:hypothetical protein